MAPSEFVSAQLGKQACPSLKESFKQVRMLDSCHLWGVLMLTTLAGSVAPWSDDRFSSKSNMLERELEAQKQSVRYEKLPG